MFWSKSPRALSLKTKVALSYAVLFIISCLALFLLVSYAMRQNMLRILDTSSAEIGDELRMEFIVGKRQGRIGDQISPDMLPESERLRIAGKFPGSQILYAYRTDTLDKSYYQSFIYYDGGYYEVMGSDGGEQIFSRLMSDEQSMQNLRRSVNRLVYERGHANLFIRVTDPEGRVQIATATPLLPANFDFRGYRSDSYTINTGGVEFRVVVFRLPDGTAITVGRNTEKLAEQLREYSHLFILVLAAMTVAGAVCGWLVSRRFIFGVKLVTRAAQRIYSGDYSHRVDQVDADEEIRELMEMFNRMNERTEQLMLELRMVTDNVAHDLKTPLTRISGTVELALSSRTPADFREVCVFVANECALMRSMIETMLEITRTNASPEVLEKSRVDLRELLAEAHELMQPLAEQGELDFTLSLPAAAVVVNADKLKIQRVIGNLLENAIKFTPQGGAVGIELTAPDSEGRGSFTVRDTGCGISEADRKHVFERFFRGDASRNRPGNGLGLALVAAIVNAHGWRIELDSQLGRGSAFTVFYN